MYAKLWLYKKLAKVLKIHAKVSQSHFTHGGQNVMFGDKILHIENIYAIALPVFAIQLKLIT